MNRFTITSAIAAAALLTVAGPATAQNREHLQMSADLQVLREQVQAQALAQEKLQAQLAAAIKVITDRLEQTDAASRKSMADQKVFFDSVTSELRIIKQNTQDTSTRLRTLSDEVDALGTAISLAGPPSSAGGDPTAIEAAVAQPGGSPAVSRSGLTPSRLYDAAWGDYTSGNLTSALTGFERYLSEFPKGDKADEAQYYIGESYRQQKKQPEAATAFTAVVQTYGNDPAREMVPDAYYRLGEAQRALGQIEAARTSWETAATKYPDSNGGILAKQRLEGLPPAAAPRQP
jgi:tol-pal system protein YbgF